MPCLFIMMMKDRLHELRYFPSFISRKIKERMNSKSIHESNLPHFLSTQNQAEPTFLPLAKLNNPSPCTHTTKRSTTWQSTNHANRERSTRLWLPPTIASLAVRPPWGQNRIVLPQGLHEVIVASPDQEASINSPKAYSQVWSLQPHDVQVAWARPCSH